MSNHWGFLWQRHQNPVCYFVALTTDMLQHLKILKNSFLLKHPNQIKVFVVYCQNPSQFTMNKRHGAKCEQVKNLVKPYIQISVFWLPTAINKLTERHQKCIIEKCIYVYEVNWLMYEIKTSVLPIWPPFWDLLRRPLWSFHSWRWWRDVPWD